MGKIARIYRSVIVALLACAPCFVVAQPAPQPGVCRAAIGMAERGTNIPPQLMHAIARVESGKLDPVSGRVNPWPWTIDVEGQSIYFETKDQAVAAVRTLQANGAQSIDVGCMQVNLMHHPTAFVSLEQAFDPLANAAYAARFLILLRDRTGDWISATAQYHSATPELGLAYQQKVLAVWPEEQRFALATRRTGIAANSGQVIAPGLANSGAPLKGVAAPVRLIQSGRIPQGQRISER